MALLETQREPITTYDFFDIANATGYNRYYGASISGAAFNTTNFTLSDQTIYSGEITSFVSGATIVTAHDDNTSGWKRIHAIDFDMDINKPQTIRGKGIVNITSGVRSNVPQTNTAGVHTVAILRKVDKDDVVTDIISGATSFVSPELTSTSNPQFSKQHAITFDIPARKIKAGEKIRLTIEQFGKQIKVAAAMYFKIGFAHDPKDRNDDDVVPLIKDADATIFTIDVPYRIRI